MREIRQSKGVLDPALMRAFPSRTAAATFGVFAISGGRKTSAIACTWDVGSAQVRCEPVEDGFPAQFSLTMAEEAATALILGLAEQIARNGCIKALDGSAARTR